MATTMQTQTPYEAHVAPAGTTSVSAVHKDDVADWVERLNQVLAKPELVTAPTGANAQPWHTKFFECFKPIDLCLITCCVPCVTFGKNHHRTRKDANLNGYKPVNPTCLGFCVAAMFGVPCIPMMMQHTDIRRQYNLEGDLATDIFKTWCCGCCTLIQQAKETEYRALNSSVSQPQYQATDQMKYGA